MNKIVAIEGGGTRGAFAAEVIARMEEDLEAPTDTNVGLWIGTSTGAIIAAAKATGRDGREIADWYKENEKQVFNRKDAKHVIGGWFTSKWNDEGLVSCLKEFFGEKKLGEITKPLIIPATNITTGRPHVFKSQYEESFTRDAKVNVWEAVRASCAAPTYFDPFVAPSTESPAQFADGGIYANNPSLMGLVDARYRLGWKWETIQILSIGTGSGRTPYKVEDERKLLGWGLLGNWKRGKLADMVIDIQGRHTHSMTCLLLGQNPLERMKGPVMRIDWETELSTAVDTTGAQGNHVARADDCVTHYGLQIREWWEK